MGLFNIFKKKNKKQNNTSTNKSNTSKVAMIKEVRIRLGCGLQEAKDVVNTLEKEGRLNMETINRIKPINPKHKTYSGDISYMIGVYDNESVWSYGNDISHDCHETGGSDFDCSVDCDCGGGDCD